MSTTIEDCFKIKDVIELLKGPSDLANISELQDKVRMPYCSGEKANRQSKIVNALSKELELTQKWINGTSSLIQDFEDLSVSNKEKLYTQFNKMRKLNEGNINQATDFLERL